MVRFVVVLVLVVPACAQYAPGVPDEALEGCFDVDAGCAADAGGTAPDADVETPPASVADDASCTALVEKACGGDEGPRCDAAPGCAAAQLVATYEPSRCGAELSNEASFPRCARTACEALVEKVCGAAPGAAPACPDAPGCDPATRLHARSVDAAASAAERDDALASCADALEDGAAFAACAP